MKKTKQILSFLLILALLFGLLPSVVAAAESEPFTFTNVELVGTAIVSGSLQEEKLIAKVNHDDKAVIRYMDGSEISTSLRMNVNYRALDAEGKEVPNIEIKCWSFTAGNVMSGILSVTDTKTGQKENYDVYFVKKGTPLHSIEYVTGQNSLGPVYDKIPVYSNPGQTEFTSGSGYSIDSQLMTSSKLKLNGLLGEVIACSPEKAITVSLSKKSATVNWLEADGKITLTLGNFPEETGVTGQRVITITDQRNIDSMKTKGTAPFGSISFKPPTYMLAPGMQVTATANPDAGYKYQAGSFSALDAHGNAIACKENKTGNTATIEMTVPYGYFTYSATFVPLEAGDKSNKASLTAVTVGAHQVEVAARVSTIRVYLNKDEEFDPESVKFSYSEGATCEVTTNKGVLQGGNKRNRIKITSEDGSRQVTYSIYFTTIAFDGKGTEEAPYTINNAADFQSFISTHPTAYYKQTADLDLSEIPLLSTGSAVGDFSGVYDGGDKKITNLKLESAVNGNAALFGTVTGTVKNLTIDSTCSFAATQWVGSFALFLKDGGKLENCVNNAPVTCTAVGSTDGTINCFAGGLVARTTSTWRGTPQNEITNCQNTGAVTVGGEVKNFASAGGLIGGLNKANVKNCVNTGEVSNENSQENYYGMRNNSTGGIAGQMNPLCDGGDSTLVGCVNAGAVIGGGNVGGLLGRLNYKGNALLIESCLNSGAVSAANVNSDQNVGGLLGLGYAEIRNSTNAGAISGETTSGNANHGTIGGCLERGNSTVAKCYAAQSSVPVIGLQGTDALGGEITVENDTTLLRDEEMKSQAFVDTLNAYTRPRTLVGVTFALPAEGENHGYPVVASCSRVQNYEAAIHAFTLAGRQGAIDEEKHTISVFLPYGTAVTALTPEIETSQGAQLDKTGAQDFTNPVSYQVTSEDGSASVAYTVTVTVAAQATGLRHLGVKLHNRELPMTDGPDGKKQVTITDAELSKGIQKLTIEYLTNNGSKASAEIDGTTLKEANSNVYDCLEWSYNTNSLTSGTRTLKMSFGSETQIIEIIIQPTLESLAIQAGEQNLKGDENRRRLCGRCPHRDGAAHCHSCRDPQE